MKKQRYFLQLILALAAFPLAAFGARSAPLYAASLLAGRTYDQAHNTGYMDWSGSVGYEDLYHVDSSSLPPEEGSVYCGTGCTENVTRINDGAVISGSFERDVTYFEAMAAYEFYMNGVGSVVVTACSANFSQNLGKAKNSDAGFNSFALSVPAGCRTWSVRAAGGYVHLRSVDVEYAAVPPTPTNTATPTFTFTPTATATGTQPPTFTFTPTSTQTSTPSATATGTALPTFTSTATLTQTSTPTATATGTLVPTRTPTASATATPVPTAVQQSVVILVPNIIINNSNTNTNTNTSSGGGSSGAGGFTAVTPAPMQGQGGAALWGATVCGGYYIRVRVYVDDNQDKLMAPAEGISGLQVFLLDQTYARLGSAYSVEGQIAFCIPPAQYGKPVYIDIPYLQQFRSVQIPEQPERDLEIWFPGEPPILPVYLP
ncbi:MAG: hypothetical protein JZU60_02540 [Ilumatobacteraceae bacterium]|nr:hypothetical protein [Ilumatobacteraceae bacterium]